MEPLIASYARVKGVKIVTNSIIYRLLEDVTELLSSKLPPKIIQRVVAEAEVLALFPWTEKKVTRNVAGCKVKLGTVTKNALVRVKRQGEIVFQGMLYIRFTL